MKKKVLVLFPLLALLLMAAPVQARQAHPARPMTTNCDQAPAYDCEGAQIWGPISTKGALTDSFVDNPSGTNFVSYKRYLDLAWDDTNGTEVQVGIDKGAGCSGLQWFYSVGTTIYTCVGAVASGDIGYPVYIGADYENSGSHQGLDIWIYADHLQSTICFPCHKSTFPNFSSNYDITTDYITHITDSGFSNHIVWGEEWLQNEYYTGSSWAYDATSGSISAGNPNQFNLIDPPAGSQNNGGDIRSCVYATGSACTNGS